MTEFALHSAETAPEAARPILNSVQKGYGFVPNLMRVMADSPETLEAYTTLMSLFERTSFDKVEKEVILLAVSQENACHYCLAAHSTVAAMKGVSQDVIDAIRGDKPLPDSRLDTIVSLVRSIVGSRGWPDAQLVKRFHDHGYTNQQYLEIVLAVSMKTLSNYVNHAADTPLDQAFAAQAQAA